MSTVRPQVDLAPTITLLGICYNNAQGDRPECLLGMDPVTGVSHRVFGETARVIAEGYTKSGGVFRYVDGTETAPKGAKGTWPIQVDLVPNTKGALYEYEKADGSSDSFVAIPDWAVVKADRPSRKMEVFGKEVTT